MVQGELKTLLETMPQIGEVTWIGLRPIKSAPLRVVDEVEAITDKGLKGDHFCENRTGKRQVTLIQFEHIQAVGSILGKEEIDPGLLRRNIVVKGINLAAFKERKFQIGEATLEWSGWCVPCSRMEENLGQGGYNAMRHHGGILAKVISGGTIKKSDKVKLILDNEET